MPYKEHKTEVDNFMWSIINLNFQPFQNPIVCMRESHVHKAARETKKKYWISITRLSIRIYNYISSSVSIFSTDKRPVKRKEKMKYASHTDTQESRAYINLGVVRQICENEHNKTLLPPCSAVVARQTYCKVVLLLLRLSFIPINLEVHIRRSIRNKNTI